MNTIERIRQLYSTHPDSKNEFRKYTYTLDEALAGLEKNPPRDFSLPTLDKYKNNLDLAIVLAHLPSEVLHSELGDDALLWTWVEYPYTTRKDEIAKEIQVITGRNPKNLEKARLTAWQLLRLTHKAELVKKIYDMNEEIMGGASNTLDLPDLLRKHTKKQVELSEKRIADYSLQPITTKNDYSHGPEQKWNRDTEFGDKVFPIYLDCPTGLALTYKGDPNAVIGFFPSSLDTISIYQIQGVKARRIRNREYVDSISARGLMPLQWEKLLVEAAEQIARKSDYRKISIRGAENNNWTKPDRSGDIHLPMEQAIQRYNVMARNLGYKKSKDKNWYKNLDEQQKTYFSGFDWSKLTNKLMGKMSRIA